MDTRQISITIAIGVIPKPNRNHAGSLGIIVREVAIAGRRSMALLFLR